MVGAIVVTALSVAAVVLAVVRVREFWQHPKPLRLYPHFEPELNAGMLPFLTVGLAISLPIMAVGLWLADGQDGAPEIFQTLVALTITPTFLISWTLGAWGRPRFLLPPALRSPEDRKRFHHAEVHDVRLGPGEDDYFIAMCDCGWTGDARPDALAARADAEEHTPNVAEAVERPLG